MGRMPVSLWDLMYLRRAPWDMDAPRPELVELVERQDLVPARAIDMGCGSGDNAIFLAGRGSEVVGIDISGRAIARARRKAADAGVSLRLLRGDVTELDGLDGLDEPFDLVVDNGCLHSLLGESARAAYAEQVGRLTAAGGHVFLRAFVHIPGAQLRPLERLAGKFHAGLSPDEVGARFSSQFAIEVFTEHHERQAIGPVITTTYWLTRTGVGEAVADPD